jgi:hypothetical protein
VTRLDTEPLTASQLGRIHREFARLGFHQTQDRAERLRLTAALARVPELGSTKDLTMGQAGRVIARPDPLPDRGSRARGSLPGATLAASLAHGPRDRPPGNVTRDANHHTLPRATRRTGGARHPFGIMSALQFDIHACT